MSSPPNSAFNSLPNNQIVSRVVANSSSALDQWQTRSQTSLALRPLITGYHQSGHQRIYSPRSHYLSASNTSNTGMTSTPTMSAMNANISVDNNYEMLYKSPSNRDQVMAQRLTYHNRNAVDEPVYSTPDHNNHNTSHGFKGFDFNYELIRDALNYSNRSQLSSAFEAKPESPESTSHLTSHSLQSLAEKLSKLTEEIKHNRIERKDVESKLNELNEELKSYEQKIQLRDEMRRRKEDLDQKEEQLAAYQQRLVAQIKRKSCNSQQSSDSLPKSETIVGQNTSQLNHKRSQIRAKEESSEDNDDKRVESTPEGIASKRPIVSSKRNAIKKVRTDDNISSALRKEVHKMAKNEPKIGKKVSQKRPNDTKASEGSKVNRICRQQTNKPNLNTSGVKTSRPQKLSSSRKKPIIANNHIKSSQIKSSLDSNEPKSSEDMETISPNPFSDPNSDNEVFEELSKCITNKDNFPSIASNESTNGCERKTSSDSVVNKDVIQTNLNSSERNVENMKINENKEKLDEKCEERSQLSSHLSENKVIEKTNKIEDNYNESQEISVERNASNDCKTNKMIEIVELFDDDEEEYVAEVEESVKIKLEKTYGESEPTLEELAEAERKRKVCKAANQIISDEAKTAMRFNCKTSDGSCSYSSGSEDQNVSECDSHNERDVFKTPSIPVIKKAKLKYKGFSPEECAPTLCYSNNSFKAIAGPKSKTARTTVILLKQYKNYLFASFMDCSLRRYHISNREDVLKYDGHEDFVLTIAFARCECEDNFNLFTGSKDKKLRAFDGKTGSLLNTIALSDEILCLDYCWSHVFAGLKNGNLHKIKFDFDTNSENQISNNEFQVNVGKRLSAIKAIDVDNSSSDSNIEAVLVVSINKIRIVNTVSSIKDEQRILHSFNVNYCVPIYMQIYDKHLFISSKLPSVKSEDNKKKEVFSKVFIYHLQKDWKPIREIPVNGIVTSLVVNHKDLIISSFDGKIQCVDCEKLELKWIAYHSHTSCSVMIGDRLIIGTQEGQIDVIYLDGKMIDCNTCGVLYARHVDYKEHIKYEHNVSHESHVQ